MNAKLTLELPKDTLVACINYIYVTPDGMCMEVTGIDGDALMDGFKICKGADGYAKED